MRPGVPGWEDLEDKYEALQIPPEICKRMSTSALADSCLNFPLSGDIFAATDPNRGLQLLIDRVGSFSELLSRADVAAVLVERYSSIDINEVIARKSEKKHSYVYFGFIHRMINRSEVVSKLTANESNRLAKLSLKYLRILRANQGVTGSDRIPATLFCNMLVSKHVSLPAITPVNEEDFANDAAITKLARSQFVSYKVITALLKKYNDVDTNE